MPDLGNQDARRTRSIVIAEPLALVREGFVALCEVRGGYSVVAACEDGEAAVKQIDAHRPDLAILDLQLTRLFTLQVCRKIRESYFPTRVAVLGNRTDRKTVREVLRSGASAYVLKSGTAQDLLDALAQILEGGVYVASGLNLEEILLPSSRHDSDDPLGSLSAREYQVFSLLVEGIRGKEIAGRLELSPKTVDTYRSSLMRKLDIHDVAGLVKFAIRHNLISPI